MAVAVDGIKHRWKSCCRCPKPNNICVPGLTLATLKRIAKRSSDTEAAQRTQKAKHALFA